jgi:hypothetical protein
MGLRRSPTTDHDTNAEPAPVGAPNRGRAYNRGRDRGHIRDHGHIHDRDNRNPVPGWVPWHDWGLIGALSLAGSGSMTWLVSLIDALSLYRERRYWKQHGSRDRANK